MRIIILVLLLYCSFVNIVNAYPVAVLLIGYDFLLLLIPFIAMIFSTIFFYFRKNIFYINIFLFFVNIFLYIYYFFHIKSGILFSLEYFIFLFFVVIFGIVWKFKVNFLNYILLIIFLYGFFIIGKLSYEVYDFKNIEKCIIKNIPNDLETRFLYKKSYMVVFGEYKNKKTYVFIDKSNEASFKKGEGIYYSGDGNGELGKFIKNISFGCVK